MFVTPTPCSVLYSRYEGLSRYTRYKAAGRGKEITAVKVATLSCLAYSHFHSFLHLKKHLEGRKIHEEEMEKKKSESVRGCARRRRSSVTSEYSKIVARLNKCLNTCSGDDVVQYLKVCVKSFSLIFLINNFFKNFYCVCAFTVRMSHVLSNK